MSVLSLVAGVALSVAVVALSSLPQAVKARAVASEQARAVYLKVMIKS
ncbi:hypothetical protein [Moraxella lacunata]